VAFSNEYGASYHAIHRIQDRQRSFLKLKSCGIPGQGEIVEAKSLAEADLAQLLVDRVGIGESPTLFSNGNIDLLFGDGQRELQLHRSAQVHGLGQRLEAVASHSNGIGPRLQVGRRKLTQPVRRQHNRLREISSADFNVRLGDDCTRLILDNARNRFRMQLERACQPEQKKYDPEPR
jgi:hypothetical protein